MARDRLRKGRVRRPAAMVEPMHPWFASFRRRAQLLAQAREALLAGRPEAALEALREPCLSTSRTARRLRERSLDALWRAALDRAGRGRDQSLGRILVLMAAEDPDRVERFHALFGPEAEEPRAARTPARGNLRALLAEMRADAAGSAGIVAGDAAEPAPDPGDGGDEEAPPAPPPRRATAGVRFELAVDDGGEFLVASGSPLLLGHSRSGTADLPFLADVAPEHARLACSESFHGGWQWTLEPLGGNAAARRGQPIAPAGDTLADGDEVDLAPNLRFRFRIPDPTSSSAVLEMLGGTDCGGAQRVLLLGPGAAGRIRIGARSRDTIRVPGLEHEIELRLDGDSLRLRAPVGMRALGPGQSTAGVSASQRVTLPCPPVERVDVVLDAPTPGRPPFSFSVRPEARP